ncbi:MAG: hypothetical protein GX780_01995 [Campylobacteraceae bacterium]|nr:hypothetical protein [Campylobacteraceae bacterium]
MFEYVEKVKTIEDIVINTKSDGSYLIIAGEDFPFYEISSNLKTRWLGVMFPALFCKEGIDKNLAFICKIREMDSLLWIESRREKEKLEDENFLIMVGGMDSEASKYLEWLFVNSPKNSIVFGGAAGSLKEDMKRCFFNGEKYTEKGAIIIGTKTTINTSIIHNYEASNEFSIVSKSKESTIYEIDFKDAFLVYKEALKEHCGLSISKENIFEHGLHHPLMLDHTFGEKTARYPISSDGKSILLAGNVAESSILSLGVISKKSLFKSSKKAKKIFKKYSCEKINALMFSSLGRSMLFENSFSDEVSSISKELKNCDLLGVLSLGEVINTVRNYIEFHNGTCVIGVSCAV